MCLNTDALQMLLLLFYIDGLARYYVGSRNTWLTLSKLAFRTSSQAFEWWMCACSGKQYLVLLEIFDFLFLVFFLLHFLEIDFSLCSCWCHWPGLVCSSFTKRTHKTRHVNLLRDPVSYSGLLLMCYFV